ncbi:MAG: hypothetical protein IT384_31480 [Deltaproteobacteria bacterium]|nr:hypothetical protein [Deltaproteobacteria bacterium]
MAASWRDPWRDAWRDERFRPRLWIMLVTLVTFSASFSMFVGYVEARTGAVLNDPFLALLPRADLTWFTFALIHIAIPVGLIALIRQPWQVVLTLQTWAAMLVLRMAAMYVTPLDPPADVIPLVDPFAQMMFGKDEAPLRDLFFSGHTSTMFILFLTATDRRMKALFFGLTLLVVAAVLIQRVHYTLDVLAAPFFVFALYRLLVPIYTPAPVPRAP